MAAPDTERGTRAYLETKIRTAPTEELFDELLRATISALDRLQTHLGTGSPEAVERELQRVVSALWELNASVAEPGSPLGRDLRAIFGESAGRAVEAVLLGQNEPLAQVSSALGRLRRAWSSTLSQA